jgi:hypothetical protein
LIEGNENILKLDDKLFLRQEFFGFLQIIMNTFSSISNTRTGFALLGGLSLVSHSCNQENSKHENEKPKEDSGNKNTV